MAVKTNNGYNLSDFSVRILEEGELIKVEVECFAENRIDMPFIVSVKDVIPEALVSDQKDFYAYLGIVISRRINDIISSEITPPEKCECQDRHWLKTHPDDRQDYWRTKDGRVYPKDHTVRCPNNPSNQRKKTNG